MDRKARGAGPRRPGAAPAAGRSRAPAARKPALAPVVVSDAPRMGWLTAIEVTVSGLGYELVEVERAPRGLLRITIDRVPGRIYTIGRGQEQRPDEGEFVTVDDCEAVTRQLQYVLEVEGLDYARLEVSSPGLDRPLKREADYQRFAGQAVRIALKAPFEGRKVWEGVLSAGEGEAWNLSFKNGKTEQVLGFTLTEVREARLVPVVDFKGRKTGAGPAGGAQTAAATATPGTDKAAADAAPDVDGGL